MSKPKILIVADSPFWAYDSILNTIRECLKGQFDVYWDYTLLHHYLPSAYNPHRRRPIWYKIKHNVKFGLQRIIGSNNKSYKYLPFFNHVITPFWVNRFTFKNKTASRRVLPPWREYDCVILLDFYFDRVANLKFRTKALVKGVYTDGFPPQGMSYDFKLGKGYSPKNIDDFVNEYLNDIDALVVGAPKISSMFKNLNRPIFFANMCENINHFKRKTAKPLVKHKKNLVIGWTGNPKREFKHFYDVIKPCIDSLAASGLPIKLKTRFEGPIETLPSFYEDVDVVVIASDADAGPSLFMEASLMDVPAISTRIGFPDHVIQDKVNGWFFDGSKEQLRDKIIWLLEHPEAIDVASRRIRANYLKKMGPERMCEAWHELVKRILETQIRHP
ncbi:MAG: glycosyltransferase [Flavobacteriales bacterium]|nr:glycosyltransferase [Flavobacteriales bacterium]